MKRSKIALAAFAVVATVGSAFAVKTTFFGSGAVYCETPSATTCTNRKDFRIDPSGTTGNNPCLLITGTVAKVLTANNVCKTVPTTTKFLATAAGK